MYEKIKQMLVEKLEIEEDIIKPESQLTSDLGLNSLELADLMLLCEDEFGVEIDDDDIEKLLTVSDIVSYLENASN